jgi:hypothetical protein
MKEVFHEINPFHGCQSEDARYVPQIGIPPMREARPEREKDSLRGDAARSGVGCFRAVWMTLEGFGEFFRERALRRLLIGPAALDVLLACPMHGPLRGGSHQRSTL